MLDHGTLHNVSDVTIPEDAANREGTLVVANLLLDPELPPPPRRPRHTARRAARLEAIEQRWRDEVLQ